MKTIKELMKSKTNNEADNTVDRLTGMYMPIRESHLTGEDSGKTPIIGFVRIIKANITAEGGHYLIETESLGGIKLSVGAASDIAYNGRYQLL